MENERIYLAVVHHKHGEDYFAARSQAGIDSQVADYCRQWWGDIFEDGTEPPISDTEAIEQYFARYAEEFDMGEYVDFEHITVLP